MANCWAKFLALGACVLFASGGSAAQAQGYRFGLWRYGGPAFGGPYFGGPRYDGPRNFDAEPPSGTPVVPPPDIRPLGPRICYSPAETRERVVTQKLFEPFALMRKASAFAHAEALAGKLCHWNDLDIYEISLLRRDGRVIHVFVNAANGQIVGARNVH